MHIHIFLKENKRCTKVSQGLMISLDGDFSCMTDDTLQFMKKVLLGMIFILLW